MNDLKVTWDSFKKYRSSKAVEYYKKSKERFIASIQKFKVGDYVTDTHTGKVGVIAQVDKDGMFRVILAGDGPYARLWTRSDYLTPATKEQYEHADRMSHSENRFT